MRRALTIISCLILIGPITSITAQQVDCDDLMDFVKQEGYYYAQVSSVSLIESTWLKEVKAYKYDYKIYVIAKIKTDEWGFNTKNYIFCSVPQSNWNNFSSIYSFDNLSYGERFHKYIMDYQCNCN